MFNDNFNYYNPYTTLSPILEENEEYIFNKEEKIFPFYNFDDFTTENYFTTREESNQKEKNQLKYDKLNEDLNSNSNKKAKKKLGRITINNNDCPKIHKKYSDENLIRMCKDLVITSFFNFLNKQMETLYNGNIGQGPLMMQFRKLNKSFISNPNADFNKNFLTKTLREIFSEDISGKITNAPKDYNKNLINKLLNEKDPFIKNFFGEVLDLKFIDCLNHFIGKKHIGILNGMKCYEDFKEKILEKYGDDGNEYCKILENYLNDFEQRINRKRSRKPKKKVNKNHN